MAKQLFKLVMSGSTNTVPTVSRYFFKSGTDITVSTTGYEIKSSLLWDDAGAVLSTSKSITTKTDNNGYYMLFINGALQQSSMYSVTSAHIQLANVTQDYTIKASAPVTLAVTNFAPVTTISG